MRLLLTLAAGLVDAPRRMIGGTAVRYGEIGYPETSAGPMALSIRAGALRFPNDVTEVPLTRTHDGGPLSPDEPRVVRGAVALVDDDPERLYLAARVVDGPLGDAALAEAADRGPDGLAALSLELENVVLEGDEIVAADVTAVGQVPDPAFNSSRIDLIAAARAPQDPTQPGGTANTGGSMTPEQIARLAALRALSSLTQEQANELVQLATLEAAQEQATEEAASTEQATEEAASTEQTEQAATQPTAVAASIPAVPAGHRPATTAVPAGGHFRAMARRVVEEWQRRGDVGMAITAALSDIVESSNDVIEAPAWSGELWSGVQYEPVWSDLFSTGNLTNWKGQGWRFTTKLEISDYAGDKAAIPSSTVTTEPSDYEAARMAVGVDIDRKFYDFPNEAFITSLFEQIRESWTEKLDGKVRAYAVANAAKATRKVLVTTVNGDATVEAANGSWTAADAGRSITGTGIPGGATILSVTDSGTIELSANATASGTVTATVDSADTSLLKVVGRLNQGAVARKLGRLTSVVVNDDDYFSLLDVTEQSAPKWLTEFVGDPTKFRPDPGIARGTAYGVVKQAATLRTLPGSPIRVSAQNIAQGGVDEAAFGYWAIEEHHTAGILKATYTPAAA